MHVPSFASANLYGSLECMYLPDKLRPTDHVLVLAVSTGVRPLPNQPCTCIGTSSAGVNYYIIYAIVIQNLSKVAHLHFYLKCSESIILCILHLTNFSSE